jgi:ATP-dependent RNA helicase DDX21
LKFRVLDEADEMLRMGFVEDVELILGMYLHAGRLRTCYFDVS